MVGTFKRTCVSQRQNYRTDFDKTWYDWRVEVSDKDLNSWRHICRVANIAF